jgi:hypothetical protein
MNDLVSPPAIVRSENDLQALAAKINASFHAAEQCKRQGAAFYRECGRWLLEAKLQCGHGNFQAWLAEHTEVSDRQARRWMRLAKTDVTSDLEEQWAVINGNKKEDQELEEWRDSWQKAGAWFPASSGRELREWLQEGPFGAILSEEYEGDEFWHKLLLDILAKEAAKHLVRTGKLLRQPPDGKPAEGDEEHDLIGKLNDGVKWKIHVQWNAGHFLNWCGQVGITLSRRKWILTGKPNLDAGKEDILKDFRIPEGAPPMGDKQLAEMLETTETELPQVLEKMMHGKFYDWVGMPSETPGDKND